MSLNNADVRTTVEMDKYFQNTSDSLLGKL